MEKKYCHCKRHFTFPEFKSLIRRKKNTMENKLTLVKEAREIISQINIDLKNKVISLEQRNHILDVIKDIQWKIELSEVILRGRH